jgi:lauroyl/myristoyl acyltransferase
MHLQIEKQRFLERLNDPSPIDIDNMSYEYSLFVANVKKFLPEIKKEEYKDFFVELLYHKWLSRMEQYDMETLHNLKVINDSSFNIEKPERVTPLIFATFHMGPFRLFNSYLFENGFKIVLIVDHNIYTTQQKEILNDVKPLLKNNKNADFIILDVKDRTSIFRLKNLLLEGYVLSVYLDGNTGFTRIRSNEFDNSFISIKFFNNMIYVKNGIGKLSLLLCADIIPVIAYRDQNESPIIHFNKEIKISDFGDRKTYPVKSIEHIYKIFEDELSTHKTQWIDWIFIHNWFKRGEKTSYKTNYRIKNIFNEDRYILFIKGNYHFLFDLYDYISYPITAELYKILKENKLSLIDLDIMAEFIKKM